MNIMNPGLMRLSTWLVSGLILAGVALAVNAVALFTGHVFDNVDLRTHYQWALQFSDVLADGTLYPRWMPLANNGLGEPSFVIVHPGYYYVLALLKSLGLDLWTAMRWAAAASTFLVGAVTFGLLYGRLLYPWAIASAMLLQTLPFAAFLFGFHAALPWHFSFPLAVLVIGLSTIRRQPRVDLLLAVSVALLCMTHLLVAFMVLLSLSALQGLSALRHPMKEDRASLLPWAGSVALGLGLSAVYWLLAATSESLFSVVTRIDDHYLNWRNSFVFPFVTSAIFGTRWAVVQWVMPIIPSVFLLVSAWALAAQRHQQGEIWHAASRLWIVGAFALLMSSELAYPLYASIPFLTKVQWPYRFLTVSSIAGALAVAMVASAAFSNSGKVLIRGAIVACALLSVALLLALQFKQYVEGASPGLGTKTMAGHIGQRGAEPASIGPDWKRYVEDGALDGYCRRNGLVCEMQFAHSHHRIWRITSDKAREVLLPLFAFPAWQVSVDEVLVAETIDQATGLIAVQIPPGSHSVSVRWSLLWQEQAGLALSAFSLVVCAIVFVVQRRRKMTNPLTVN
ncbi:hypothetical protein [Accumulibacter sp.]|uniref:hypothetical protein n=1 Tax=Accumulibacter sp. TaxID=2053492 RepID=UPI001A4AC239|nr:hypothetical protein [Accumulibacter sp.]MBL8375700.1 hypothetical protein [Accumulibacter sp.]